MKEQIYVLCSGEWSDFHVYGVVVGPAGQNMADLEQRFRHGQEEFARQIRPQKLRGKKRAEAFEKVGLDSFESYLVMHFGFRNAEWQQVSI